MEQSVFQRYPKLSQAIGAYISTIVTGLMVYQSYPESLSQFGSWVWQPNLQGITMALAVLGINGATNGNRK